MALDSSTGMALGITLVGGLGTFLLASLEAVLGRSLGTLEQTVLSRARGTARGGGGRPPGTAACTAGRASPPLATQLYKDY